MKKPQYQRKVNPTRRLTAADFLSKAAKQYVELSGKAGQNPEVATTIQKIETMLGSIKETFDRQLTNLLEDDLLDLNAEKSDTNWI